MAPEARAIITIAGYELKKTLARKRVLAIVALIFLLEVSIYLISTLLPRSFIAPFIPVAWAVGLLAPAGLLLHILALTVGSASFSEEYELGTADYWLTRPVSTTEYFVGKVAGSAVFMTLIIALYSVLSLLLPWFIYGPQSKLEFYVLGVSSSILAMLTFLSIGIAMGEILRRSMLATITSAAAFFASFIAEFYLNIVSRINNDPSLIELSRLLPTWPSIRLVSSVVAEALPGGLLLTGPAPIAGTIPAPELGTALASISMYAAIFLAMAHARLSRTDVTRRAT